MRRIAILSILGPALLAMAPARADAQLAQWSASRIEERIPGRMSRAEPEGPISVDLRFDVGSTIHTEGHKLTILLEGIARATLEEEMTLEIHDVEPTWTTVEIAASGDRRADFVKYGEAQTDIVVWGPQALYEVQGSHLGLELGEESTLACNFSAASGSIRVRPRAAGEDAWRDFAPGSCLEARPDGLAPTARALQPLGPGPSVDLTHAQTNQLLLGPPTGVGGGGGRVLCGWICGTPPAVAASPDGLDRPIEEVTDDPVALRTTGGSPTLSIGGPETPSEP